MRILHIILSLNYGGAENMLVKILNEDKVNDHRIVVIINNCPLKENLVNRNIIHPLFEKRSINIVKAIFRLIKIIKTFKPEILQSWMYHSELIGLVIKLFYPNVKLFWNVRNSTNEWLKLRKRNNHIFRILKWGAKRTSGIIVNSKVEKAELINLGYPANKLIYIPNGFNTIIKVNKEDARKKLLETFQLNDNTILLGMVARFHPQKDHYNLINAFSLIAEQEPHVHLILIGNGFTDEFIIHLKEIKLDSRVHFFGTTQSIYEVIAGLDIATLTSFTESFPNVVGEYMIASLPIVATDVSDVSEILGDSGFIVPPKDYKMLAKELLNVLRLDYSEKERIGKAAHNRIVENYPIEKISKSYINYYNESLKGC